MAALTAAPSACREVETPRERQAVRALVLAAPGNEILLLRFRNPSGGEDLWLTPGGGVRSGESAEAALRREVWEETGLRLTVPAPLVWQREHTYTVAGERVRQSEDIHLVRTQRFEATDGHNPERGERAIFRGFRWWTVEEMRDSADLFVPLGLPGLVENLLERGVPDSPITVS
ncbi:MAG: NUDIX domain-containing protein [Gammaproteobacteria bacterium]|nr:NUDIX domain-containing protein [Gammaproteobacteria bacterium]